MTIVCCQSKSVVLSVVLLSSVPGLATGNQPAPPTSHQPVETTRTQPAPPTSTRPAPQLQPAPPTSYDRVPQAEFLPDLFVSRIDWKPSLPNRKEPMDVRIIINNKGLKGSGAFTVEWWPGDMFKQPGCTWRVENLQIKESRALQCSGYIYPSWYGRIRMAIIVDSNQEIDEPDERNNKLYRETQVRK